MKDLLEGELVLDVEDLIVLHEVNLEEHVLSVPDELLAHLGCLLVSLKLGVLLACVESLLVGVDLSLDLARGDKFSQLRLNDFER